MSAELSTAEIASALMDAQIALIRCAVAGDPHGGALLRKAVVLRDWMLKIEPPNPDAHRADFQISAGKD